MRHRIHHRKLNRTSEHRRALRRNLAQSLIEHGRVTTTVAKAKDLRPFIERLITLAIKTRRRAASDDRAGSLQARRRIHRLLGDRATIDKDHRDAYEAMSDAQRARTLRMVSGRRFRTGEPKGRLAFTAESVTHRLLETIAPRFEDRPGGYTRVIRLAKRRIGDASFLAVVQLVGEEEAPTSLTKPGKSSRKRRTDGRYAMAIRTAKRWTDKGSSGEPDARARAKEASAPSDDAEPDTGDRGDGDAAKAESD